ncbi:MAG: hypothetical protein CML66_15950 [Rhodobacteraceae bacterium]|nr:hypothetical protein [Paracoccaceae bacterium]MAY43931.1 hypothetical protein [Paracoccaceae bacterium]
MLSKFEWVREKLTAGPVNPFKDVSFDEKKFTHAMSWTPAKTRYVVFFTPRSGSSRLTDLASRTKALGNPGECYNPAFVPDIAKSYSARNLDEYTQLLLRHRQTKGVFGCEVTHMHVLATHKTGQVFLDTLQPTSTLWLIREDIIAQAVSVSRMMQTKVSHSVSADAGAIAQAEQVFRYEPKVILNVLRRMRWMEDGTEALIRDAGLTPLRLSYEQTVRMQPRRLMAVIGKHVGVPARRMDLDALESSHKKVSGEKSGDFAARFRAEYPDLVAQLEAERAPMLAAHAGARTQLRQAQRAAEPDTAAKPPQDPT